MREIKFRVWDKDEHKIISFSHIWIELENGYGGVKERISETIPAEFRDVDDFELMQFTGFHDKNGKEIYEGDIIKFDRVMNEGSVEEHVRAFKFPVKFQDGCFVVDDWYLHEVKCEVIGNIYKNPELLEV